MGKDQEKLKTTETAPKPLETSNPAVPAKGRKMSFKEKRELELLEKEIETMEQEKKQLEDQLTQGSLPYEQLQAAASRIGQLLELLDEKSMRWLELSELSA